MELEETNDSPKPKFKRSLGWWVVMIVLTGSLIWTIAIAAGENTPAVFGVIIAAILFILWLANLFSRNKETIIGVLLIISLIGVGALYFQGEVLKQENAQLREDVQEREATIDWLIGGGLDQLRSQSETGIWLNGRVPWACFVAFILFEIITRLTVGHWSRLFVVFSTAAYFSGIGSIIAGGIISTQVMATLTDVPNQDVVLAMVPTVPIMIAALKAAFSLGGALSAFGIGLIPIIQRFLRRFRQ